MTESERRGLLEVNGLTIEYGSRADAVRAVDDVSFQLQPGGRLGIVGESGSGKTTLGLALAGLLPRTARIVSGSICYEGRELVGLGERDLRGVRGKEVAVVFQDAKTALDPVRTIGSQIGEAVRAHRPVSRQESLGLALRLLKEVELPDPERRLRQYPHELSGGQRQRAMIAMALAGEPKVLVADEPTSALDVTTQAKIIDLLKRLGDERAMATILVTHDLGVVAGFAKSVLVMYAAAAVETGAVGNIFGRPAHPYTRALIEAVPSLTGPRMRRLRFIPGGLPRPDGGVAGCRFEPRCPVGQGNPRCQGEEPGLRPTKAGTVAACFFPFDERLSHPAAGSELAVVASPMAPVAEPDPVKRSTLLEVSEIVKTFRVSRGGGATARLRAIGGVSLVVGEGESFGIVGESGSGKTTLARILVGLEDADSGSLHLAGDPTVTASRSSRRRTWRPGEIQMIFQDPSDSLDPLMTVEQLVAEPLEITRGGRARRYRAEVAQALTAVGLSESMMTRRASQLSGGQRQRIAIARALTTKPRLLIADEAVASLDMSARGQVLNLLSDIQAESDLTCVHISHDLSMVRNVCERVAVMHAGKIVEVAPAEELFVNPRHPYTAGLISAIPVPDPSFERSRSRVEVVGELPDLTRHLVGCAYRSRCPNAKELCAMEDPPLVEGDPGHAWACHFPERPHLDLASESASVPETTAR
ncbi:MAG: oligopeptide/dipeptide transporter, ATPase subunit [Acidimicrobiaceae bacterium]|nr:oligopeptide/dipeptide transporter, ATPase subunit [Acidimicrobiaceae bacterium]